MPLQYAPVKFKATVLKGLDEATSTEDQIRVLRQQIEALVDYLNVELARNANAVNSAGGQKTNYRDVTADTLVASTDGTIGFDTTAGNVTASLPLAREYPGIIYCGKEIAGANVAAFGPRGSDTIDGVAAAYAVTSTPVWIQADAPNNNWVVIG